MSDSTIQRKDSALDELDCIPSSEEWKGGRRKSHFERNSTLYYHLSAIVAVIALGIYLKK